MGNNKLNKRFIPITDDYMFCSVLENEERCKEFLQRVLGIKIATISCVCRQKDIKNTKDARGVRLDVYVTDVEGNSYDIEMQTTEDKDIVKRARYYHSEMDGYLIHKGVPIKALGKNVVIFVCTYDPFGFGESIYTIKSRCDGHPELSYEDEVITVYLNVNGRLENVDGSLKNVIEYIRTGNVTDSFTKELENEVVLLNSDTDWRARHMTFEMKLEQRYDMGYEDGLRQGVKQSIESVIRSMLEQQLSWDVIMKVTGCTEQDIEYLIKK